MENRIKELLFEHNAMTVTELAKRAHASRTLISELVNSESIPAKTRFDVLQRVASVLQVPISALFNDQSLKVQVVEVRPVIDGYAQPLTLRQQHYNTDKQYSGGQKIYAGYLLAKLSDNQGSVSFSYFGSTIGWLRLETFGMPSENYPYDEFEKSAGIKLDAFFNDPDFINRLSSFDLSKIAKMVADSPQFKEIIDLVSDRHDQPGVSLDLSSEYDLSEADRQRQIGSHNSNVNLMWAVLNGRPIPQY